MIYKIIIGNIIALVASILMVYSGFIKKKKKILYIQTTQIGLSVVSNIILGGITGAIINFLCCIRNILYYNKKLNTFFKVLLTILSIILSLKFNNSGFIGLLPLISMVSYIWLMSIKNIIGFKSLIIFSTTMWLIYDFSIKSYTSSIFDFMNIVANFISILQILYEKKNISPKTNI